MQLRPAPYKTPPARPGFRINDRTPRKTRCIEETNKYSITARHSWVFHCQFHRIFEENEP